MMCPQWEDRKKRCIWMAFSLQGFGKRVNREMFSKGGAPPNQKMASTVWTKFTSQLQKADPPGTLPKPCNAGFVDMEWVIEYLTKREVQQSLQKVVPRIQKVPPQGFFSVPAESVAADFYNVKVYFRS